MLLAALVVLWFVVLVPMVVTRGDARAATAGVADSGRTLKRRRSVDPVVSAETEREAIDRAQLYRTGELKVDVHAIRRRTLAGLLTLAVLTLAGAIVLRAWLWIPQLVLDAAVVGYLLVLRRAARRERMAARRAARAAAREALRLGMEDGERGPAARPAMSVRRVMPPAAAAQEAVAKTAVPHVPAPAAPLASVPLAPVHPLRPGRVVAARTVTPAGWQSSAVVGLDDDDIGFADIDVYQPRAVNG